MITGVRLRPLRSMIAILGVGADRAIRVGAMIAIPMITGNPAIDSQKPTVRT